MIRSFACAYTETFFHSRAVSRFRNIERVARRRRRQIHAVTELASLRILPGKQLEALKADRIRNMARLHDEIHPGEILLEDFMTPMGISARRLAADIDVSPSRISELLNGQRPITADTALRLGMFFGMEPRFWLNLQSEYDIRVADRKLRAKLSPRIRVFQPVAG